MTDLSTLTLKQTLKILNILGYEEYGCDEYSKKSDAHIYSLFDKLVYSNSNFSHLVSSTEVVVVESSLSLELNAIEQFVKTRKNTIIFFITCN